MTRAGHAWLTLVGGACLFVCFVGCNSSSARDMYFGTDAGADFDVPPRSMDSGADTTGAGGQAGATAGTDGTTAGTGGATAGTGGAGDGTDADTDAVSDGGAG
jgi:hypothetical protein